MNYGTLQISRFSPMTSLRAILANVHPNHNNSTHSFSRLSRINNLCVSLIWQWNYNQSSAILFIPKLVAKAPLRHASHVRQKLLGLCKACEWATFPICWPDWPQYIWCRMLHEHTSLHMANKSTAQLMMHANILNHGSSLLQSGGERAYCSIASTECQFLWQMIPALRKKKPYSFGTATLQTKLPFTVTEHWRFDLRRFTILCESQKVYQIRTLEAFDQGIRWSVHPCIMTDLTDTRFTTQHTPPCQRCALFLSGLSPWICIMKPQEGGIDYARWRRIWYVSCALFHRQRHKLSKMCPGDILWYQEGRDYSGSRGTLELLPECSSRLTISHCPENELGSSGFALSWSFSILFVTSCNDVHYKIVLARYEPDSFVFIDLLPPSFSSIYQR
jgi:hypothetical protein